MHGLMKMSEYFSSIWSIPGEAALVRVFWRLMRVHRLWSRGILSLVLGAVPVFFPVRLEAQDRALYVWKLAPRLDRPEEIFAVSRKASIHCLFLAVSKQALEKPAKLGAFLTRTHAAGLEAYAVVSENTWALEANREAGLTRIRQILALNRSLKKEVRFSGIHLDVEVHALARFKAAKRLWRRNPGALDTIRGLLKQWLAWIEAVVDVARKETPPLEVSVAVPHWFLKPGSPYRVSWEGREEEVTVHVMRRVDEVVVMAYAAKPTVIPRLAREETALAAKPDMARVRVAVSVSPRGPRETSLFAGGLEAFSRAMGEIRKSYGDASGHAGTAVHMYEGLRRLVE